jgi:hypothetical protein
MKTTVLSLALLVAAATFTTCRKDNDDPTSYFKYDGKTYETTFAQIENEGTYLDLSTSALDFANQKFSGKVSGINISFINAVISEGTYTYKQAGANDFDRNKNFFDATTGIDITVKDGNADFSSGIVLDDITAGTATITKNDNIYTVNYDLDFNGSKIAGRNSGSIKQEN